MATLNARTELAKFEILSVVVLVMLGLSPSPGHFLVRRLDTCVVDSEHLASFTDVRSDGCKIYVMRGQC